MAGTGDVGRTASAYGCPEGKEHVMHTIQVKKDALAVEQMGDYAGRSGELGEYTVAFEKIPAGFPPGGADAFKGLPDDACQCPHWGFLYKGSFRVSWPEGHTEVVRSGNAYYLPAGHRYEALEDCETIEFSPTEPLQRSLAVIGENVEAALTAQQGQ
jgi:hypothetical protein